MASASKKMDIENPTAHGVLYRGIMVRNDDVMHHFLTSDHFTMNGIESTSATYKPSIGIRSATHGNSGYSVLLRFKKVKRATALLTDPPSRYPHEAEMLLPNAKYKITKRMFNSETETVHLDVEEVD
jgi:hypothetical protein